MLCNKIPVTSNLSVHTRLQDSTISIKTHSQSEELEGGVLQAHETNNEPISEILLLVLLQIFTETVTETDFVIEYT